MAKQRAGPGSILARALETLGFAAPEEGGCGCHDLAAYMDAVGPAWCRAHEHHILQKMEQNAKKLGYTWHPTAAKALLRASIAAAEGLAKLAPKSHNPPQEDPSDGQKIVQ